jgi:hypothetical protein|nr:MAG TPA: hypothetical protein [Caudoviricetes sp.]
MEEIAPVWYLLIGDRTKKRYEDVLVDPASVPDWMH